MLENELEPVLTKRNHKLLNIAKVCEVVAWVCLVAYFFYSYFDFVRVSQTVGEVFPNPTSHLILNNQYFERILENPFVGIKIAIDMFIVIMKGIMGFLTLFGVSYGLKMLVETDVNYRLNKGEKVNE